MTKFLLHVTRIIALIVASIAVSSCKYNIDFGESITGSGNVTTEKRSLSEFDKVTVSRGLDCEVYKSDTQEVVVEADDNLVKGIKTKVENGTLVITSDYDNYRNVKSKKIIVRMPKISSLETTSGSSMVSKNVLTSSNLQIKSSSGSNLNLDVEADNVMLEASSGSHQTVKGKALKLQSDSSSGSSIEANNLLANDVFAQTSSGSSTTVNPIVLLDAKASSGSSINYVKKPKEIRKEESSGGSVSED